MGTTNQTRLNKLTPGAWKAKLGDIIFALIAGVNNALGDGLLAKGTLLIDAVPEKFKTTTIAAFRIAQQAYTKAATTALVFSAAYSVNLAAAAPLVWGAFLVQINAAGTVTTKAVTADQSYGNEQAAINALPLPDALNVKLGHITVQAKTLASWDATVDDLTDGSDCTEANFYDAPVVGSALVSLLDT